MTAPSLIASLLLLAALAGCQSAPEKALPAAPVAATPPAAEQVTLTPAQARAAGVEVGPFLWQNVATPVQAAGMIDVPPQNRVDISAMLGGYVQKINVLPGQKLRAGEVVAVLRDPAYIKLQQDYLQSRARTTFLQLELARQQTLSDEDAGARRKLEQATAEYQTERAAERGLAAQIELLGLSLGQLRTGRIVTDVPLRAPIGGHITAVNVNVGQYVNPRDVLAEVIDRSDLHLQLKVFQKDAARVRVGQRVLFSLPNGAGTDERSGEIILVANAYDQAERSVEIHAHLDEGDADDLLPGQYVNARIQTGAARQRTLPEDAIMQAGELSYVFVRTGQSAQGATFRRYKVRTGPLTAGFIAVTPLETLPDSTQLVRRGAFFLEAERGKGGEGSPE